MRLVAKLVQGYVPSLMALGFLALPAPSVAQDTVERNVVFGVYYGLPLTMDVFHPRDPNRHAVVVLPGTGWHAAGRGYADPEIKSGYGYIHAVRDSLVSGGFTVFVPNYRLAPGFRYPAAVDDVRRAVRFIRAEAEHFGIEPHRIGALGHSAGGHLAALLGVQDGRPDPHTPDAVEEESSRVQAVVTIAGAFDLLAFAEATRASFMGERPPWGGAAGPARDRYVEASPVYHVTPDDASFLIIQGDRDRVVSPDEVPPMESALREAGVPVEVSMVEGGGHAPRLDMHHIVSWLMLRLEGQ